MKSCGLKNTAHKNVVVYLIERARYITVANFYLFLFPDTRGVALAKKCLAILWNSRDHLTGRWRKIDVVMEIVLNYDHKYGDEVNYSKEVSESSWVKH